MQINFYLFCEDKEPSFLCPSSKFETFHSKMVFCAVLCNGERVEKNVAGLLNELAGPKGDAKSALQNNHLSISITIKH
jgi:hypothetical protein